MLVAKINAHIIGHCLIVLLFDSIGYWDLGLIHGSVYWPEITKIELIGCTYGFCISVVLLVFIGYLIFNGISKRKVSMEIQ